MPDHRLIAIITALLLASGATSVRAEYNIDQLRMIEGFILKKDCAALWQYLAANPSITVGDDALSQELRVFLEATRRGQLECFSARAATAAIPPGAPIVNFAADPGVIY